LAVILRNPAIAAFHMKAAGYLRCLLLQGCGFLKAANDPVYGLCQLAEVKTYNIAASRRIC
jgi:hypothetical protein